MKRKMKWISMLLTFCVLLSLPMTVFAAEGRMSFTDLTTPAGEEFQITMNITTDVGIGEINVTLDYDNEVIEFLSGDNLTANNSQLIYKVEGDGSETTVKTYATFMALKNASTKITIAELSVTDVDGNEIDTIEGNSAINIEGGTEVEPSIPVTPAVSVDVDGVQYGLESTFDITLLPEGYETVGVPYGDTSVTMSKSEATGMTLAYLVDPEGKGDFFLYKESDNSFSPYVQKEISDTSYIIFTTEPVTRTIPEQYVETTLTINEHVFQTWEDTKNPGLYLIHVIDKNGEFAMYQYDTQDQTYQRFDVPEVEVEPEQTGSNELVNKIMDFVSLNAVLVLGTIALVFFILLLVIIILGVKLSNRNSELDDLYDEYGYDDDISDSEMDVKQTTQTSKVESSKKIVQSKPVVEKKGTKTAEQAYYEDSDEFDDDFDDDYDDEFDDEEFDDYDDEEFDDYDDEEFDDEEFDDDDFDDFDDYDDEFDEDFEEPKMRTKLRSESKSKKKDEIDEDIDFINL